MFWGYFLTSCILIYFVFMCWYFFIIIMRVSLLYLMLHFHDMILLHRYVLILCHFLLIVCLYVLILDYIMILDIMCWWFIKLQNFNIIYADSLSLCWYFIIRRNVTSYAETRLRRFCHIHCVMYSRKLYCLS